LARTTRLALVLCAALAVGLAAPAVARGGTWCGNDVAQSNREPEVVAGNQIHVIYAYPADGADRFAAVASPIVTDLESIDAWWRSQDPTRTPRFDQFAFPGCAPGLTRLDLSSVRLPNAGSHYAERATVLPRLFVDLGGSPFGFTHNWAKYLIYYDGPMSEQNTCGVGNTPTSLTVARTLAAVFLQTCMHFDDLGTGGARAWTAVHEIGHNLSAVQRAAPNACADSGHTCDHNLDLMSRFINRPLSQAFLDFNHDDWYAHNGGWPDVQDSPWLYRLGAPRPQLTVALAGAAADASVHSELPGISCPPQCSVDWDPGAEVRLGVTIPSGQRFVRWQGGCTNLEDLCVLTLDTSKNVTAVFGPSDYTLRLSVAGKGVIRTSLGNACARRCSALIAADEIVRLRAQPRRGQRFVRWSGACRGRKLTCSVKLTANRSVRAQFAPRPSR
jgi:Divergent InlB B-repeat domain